MSHTASLTGDFPAGWTLEDVEEALDQLCVTAENLGFHNVMGGACRTWDDDLGMDDGA